MAQSRQTASESGKHARPSERPPHSLLHAAVGGAGVGVLGGLIGLGGAEFRLPLLIRRFHFGALEAIVVNKTMSLVVVAFALPFRAHHVSVAAIVEHWPAVFNLIGGSLVGAWCGANWAVRLRSDVLYRIIAILLLAIAAILLFGHEASGGGAPMFTGSVLVATGVVAGFGIGVVAALLGVAGGELLIPTFVLLFGVDVKLAGSLSLVVSLPTMLVSFARYTRDRSFATVRANRAFVACMAIGSVAGAFLGGRFLLGVIPHGVLMPLLALILVVSAIQVWRHRTAR